MDLFKEELNFILDDSNLYPLLYQYYNYYSLVVTNKSATASKDVKIQEEILDAMSDDKYVYIKTKGEIKVYDFSGVLIQTYIGNGELFPGYNNDLYVISGGYLLSYHINYPKPIKCFAVADFVSAIGDRRHLFILYKYGSGYRIKIFCYSFRGFIQFNNRKSYLDAIKDFMFVDDKFLYYRAKTIVVKIDLFNYLPSAVEISDYKYIIAIRGYERYYFRDQQILVNSTVILNGYSFIHYKHNYLRLEKDGIYYNYYLDSKKLIAVDPRIIYSVLANHL